MTVAFVSHASTTRLLTFYKTEALSNLEMFSTFIIFMELILKVENTFYVIYYVIKVAQRCNHHQKIKIVKRYQIVYFFLLSGQKQKSSNFFQGKV